MKKKIICHVFLLMISNAGICLAQEEPETIVPDEDKFELAFYESLKQKGIENYDKALVSLEECILLKPNEAVVLSEMGKNYYGLKNYPESYLAFEKAAQINPKNKWFWAGMYEASYEAKNYEQALIPIVKLIEFDAVYKEDLTSLYMKTQQFDKALALINELNESAGKTAKRNAYKDQILSQSQFQNIEIKNQSNQINKNPQDEANYIALIKMYLENGETKKALEVTQKLETALPESVWAKVGMFKHYIDTKDNVKALNALQLVSKSDALGTRIKLKILKEYMVFLNKNPQHTVDFETSISKIEAGADAEISKEIGYYFFGKKQWTSSINYLESSLKKGKTPLEAEINIRLTEAYIANNQYEIAAKKTQDFVDTFPTQPEFYYYNGLANNQLQNYKKAKELLEMGLDYVVSNTALEINFNQQLANAFKGLGDNVNQQKHLLKVNLLSKKK